MRRSGRSSRRSLSSAAGVDAGKAPLQHFRRLCHQKSELRRRSQMSVRAIVPEILASPTIPTVHAGHSTTAWRTRASRRSAAASLSRRSRRRARARADMGDGFRGLMDSIAQSPAVRASPPLPGPPPGRVCERASMRPRMADPSRPPPEFQRSVKATQFLSSPPRLFLRRSVRGPDERHRLRPESTPERRHFRSFVASVTKSPSFADGFKCRSGPQYLRSSFRRRFQRSLKATVPELCVRRRLCPQVSDAAFASCERNGVGPRGTPRRRRAAGTCAPQASTRACTTFSSTRTGSPARGSCPSGTRSSQTSRRRSPGSALTASRPARTIETGGSGAEGRRRADGLRAAAAPATPRVPQVVTTPGGRRVAVVHQYDRFPNLAARYYEAYAADLPGAVPDAAAREKPIWVLCPAKLDFGESSYLESCE